MARDSLHLIPGYDPFANSTEFYFDETEAGRALRFFERELVFIDGQNWQTGEAIAGHPFVLQSWEQAIVANLFGWKRKADHSRRYRTAFILVPRKTGKTTLIAGIACYVHFCDGEVRAQNYVVASTRDQARILFGIVSGMIESNSILRNRCRVYQHSIVEHTHKSTFKALASEAGPVHGLGAHLAIADEVHTHKNRNLIDALRTGIGHRRQPLMIYITTADFYRESICNELHDYAEKVRDGIIENAAFLPVIYAASKDDDWHDEEVWRCVNPNLDVSVPISFLRGEHKQACEVPSQENTFKRLYLNIRTEQEERFIRMEDWDECAAPFEEYELQGCPTWGGVDLATVEDMAAFVQLWRKDDEYYCLPWFYCPRETAQRREMEGYPYLVWARQEHLHLSDGPTIDFAAIKARILERAAETGMVDIGIDRSYGAQMSMELEAEGLQLFGISQGFASMAEPMRKLEEIIMNRKLHHGGNPILRWMASNVAIIRDTGGRARAVKPNRQAKIDGIVALLMALARSLTTTGDAYIQTIYDTGRIAG